MKKDFLFVDINTKEISGNMELVFKNWEKGNERICVFSPHDDDAIIGAGYAIKAAQENGAEVYIFIFCNGNAGYSTIGQKDRIVEIRKNETVNAYETIGIPAENIIRMDLPDFSAIQSIGWFLNNGKEGSFKEVIPVLRKLKITRILVPNHYREHIDHYAVNLIGSYDSPQAGDPIVVDWGEPYPVKSVLEYSVWADFSPEDALVHGRSAALRANRIIAASSEIEESIQQGISCYISQGEIIKGLIKLRKERLCNNGMYIETYISFDPRPKLDLAPYKDFLSV